MQHRHERSCNHRTTMTGFFFVQYGWTCCKISKRNTLMSAVTAVTVNTFDHSVVTKKSEQPTQAHPFPWQPQNKSKAEPIGDVRLISNSCGGPTRLQTCLKCCFENAHLLLACLGPFWLGGCQTSCTRHRCWRGPRCCCSSPRRTGPYSPPCNKKTSVRQRSTITG